MYCQNYCKTLQTMEMQFQGDTSYVRLVVYSPDGRKIASASDVKTHQQTNPNG